MYYKGTNEAEWILNIRQTLISQRMSEHVSGITEQGTVEDPKGNLRYLEVQAEAEAAAQESSAAAEGEGSSEDGNASQDGEGTGEPEDAEDTDASQEPEASGESESAEDSGEAGE